jgi:hypothetical protein
MTARSVVVSLCAATLAAVATPAARAQYCGLVTFAAAGPALAADAAAVPGTKTVTETVLVPTPIVVVRQVPTTVMTEERTSSYKPVHDTAYQTVIETIQVPVTETVMKEVKYSVQRNVQETLYREVSYTVTRPVTEVEVKTDYFHVAKPVSETTWTECQVTTCKPVCETVLQECPKVVCRTVTEKCEREYCRTITRDVCEKTTKDVCKTVCVPVTTTKTVCKKVPEVVCEQVCVKGGLKLCHVPKYETCFDPCSCQSIQKPCGKKLALVREPDRTETRQVTRCKTVTEQVPCTHYEKKTVVEKVPVTVHKKVTEKVIEKVPSCVTKQVRETVIEKVPVNLTRMQPVTETKPVAHESRRTACGAYVDSSCLTAGVKPDTNGCILGSAAADACGPNAKTYDCGGEGRVFVEGQRVARVTACHHVRMATTCETKRVPYTECRTVCEEVVKQVPTHVTRMCEKQVTKQVPVCSVRLERQECVRTVPTPCVVEKKETVIKMVPTQVTRQVPACGACGCGSAAKACAAGCGPAKPCGNACGHVCAPAKPCGPTHAGGSSHGCGTACGPVTKPCQTKTTCCEPCRPTPVRDFFDRLCSRIACHKHHDRDCGCKPAPACGCTPAPVATPSPEPKAPVPAGDKK